MLLEEYALDKMNCSFLLSQIAFNIKLIPSDMSKFMTKSTLDSVDRKFNCYKNK